MKAFRKLKEQEIDVKVGSVTSKGYTLLLYKNARVDMAILDEAVGAENWQNKFYEVVGNLYCSLGININYDKKDKEPLWVWKDDCGVESDFGDKEKGQASDARKRAGFAWGIGRELYTSPKIFIHCETIQDGKGYKIANYEDRIRSNNMKVVKITYDDNNCIKDLIIVDQNGEITFQTGKSQNTKQNQTQNSNKASSGDFVLQSGKYKGKTIAQVYDEDKSYLEFCLKSSAVSSNIKSQIKSYIDGRQ